jgi:4-oxalocrotonate tautomerase
MPVVRIEIWEKQSAEFKRNMAKDITKIVTEHVKCPDKAVTVIFEEIPKENWAIGGELACDCFPAPKKT